MGPRFRGNDTWCMAGLMSDFESNLRDNAAEIERTLDTLLSVERLSGPAEPPARLIEAMRHGTLNGGKRLRPLLLRETARMLGVAPDLSLPAASPRPAATPRTRAPSRSRSGPTRLPPPRAPWRTAPISRAGGSSGPLRRSTDSKVSRERSISAAFCCWRWSNTGMGGALHHGVVWG